MKSAIRTGAPTIRSMNTVRRDQSISPIDRSKIRKLDVRNPGAGGSGRVCTGSFMALT